jgi:hypothetical protein
MCREDTVTIAEVGGSLALKLSTARRREPGQPDCYILDPIGRRGANLIIPTNPTERAVYTPRDFRLAVLGVRNGREGELFRAEFNINDGFDPRITLASVMLTYHSGSEPSINLTIATADMFLEGFYDQPVAVAVWALEQFLSDLSEIRGRK